MAVDSVGQISLDLVVNQAGFNKQMAGIQGLAKKAGAALAAAFAVKKIVDFGAQCIKLGSDLQEVQNVVDVTFPRMQKQVNAFAQNAAVSFGLSETTAKKFTGTFGAMAKAFGFNEQAAFEMSTALTGLSGDVASFYNISQDEAYTKLKSVFTGETETLKDLGVVMTQNALDGYAMANGYGKVTAKMSEAEKVALRYKFVQEQLSLASGDFIRTSDGWANQVRVLSLQFDSLKATIGQGLINVLTPVIKVINTIIGKLMSLANAFKAFTEMVTGKKSGGGTSAAASGMEAMAESADKAGAAAGSAGGAAKKAAKDMKGITTGIDELNIISAPDDSGSGGGAGGGYAADEFDMGESVPPTDEIDNRFQGLINKAKELANLFGSGFNIAFGDTSVLDSVKASVDGIGNSLRVVFLDPEVLGAADNFTNHLALNFGKAVGGMASVGASIADNILGGINLYLGQNTPRIQGFLVSMFNVGAKASSIFGRSFDAIGTVFEAFRSNSAKQITADILGIFSEAFMGVTELGWTFGADILDVITGPFVDNADLIKSAMENAFSAWEPLFSDIKEIVQETFGKLKTTYDIHVAPMLTAFKDGFTKIATKLLELYNTYMLPVIQNLSKQFGDFKDQYLSPLIDKFMEFAGKVADAITTVWVNFLQPFILWFMDYAAPSIAAFVQGVIDVFFTLFSGIAEVIGHILDALGGLMDFIVGVFTGDWDKAWNGIKTYLTSTWKSMEAAVRTIINTIRSIISGVLNTIKATWEDVWNAIGTFIAMLWNAIKVKAEELFGAIRDKISEMWNNIRDKTSEIWDGIKKTLGEIWDNAKKAATDTFTNIKDSIIGAWNTLKTETKNIWDGIWGAIKGVINSIIGGVETMVNRVIDGINGMIEAVNNVADYVPGVSNELIPTIRDVKLPRLAQGGYVKANTPRLAMIGDNQRYGEIVAPENKMQEMVDRAVAMASANSGQGGMSEMYLETMVELLRKIVELIESMDLTVSIDLREVKKKLSDLDKRTGYTLRTT